MAVGRVSYVVGLMCYIRTELNARHTIHNTKHASSSYRHAAEKAAGKRERALEWRDTYAAPVGPGPEGEEEAEPSVKRGNAVRSPQPKIKSTLDEEEEDVFDVGRVHCRLCYVIWWFVVVVLADHIRAKWTPC